MCVVRNPSPRTGLYYKHATPMSQLFCSAVGIEEHSLACWDRGALGCCGNPSPLVANSRKNINTYILSYICTHTHTCTLALFVIFVVPLPLQAELAPQKIIKNMRKTPSQHVAPCNGIHRYSLPTRAHMVTGGKYPGGAERRIRNAIAFEDLSHSRSDGAKSPIAIHISILARRGRPFPLDLSPHCM